MTPGASFEAGRATMRCVREFQSRTVGAGMLRGASREGLAGRGSPMIRSILRSPILRRCAVRGLLLALGLAAAVRADLSGCGFHYGVIWQGDGADYPPAADYVAAWAGSDEAFNDQWHGAMLRATMPGGRAAGKIPAFYSAIATFTARQEGGLADCGAGASDLCRDGADFVRGHRDRILQRYAEYAKRTAEIVGSRTPVVWFLEPGAHRLALASQNGGPLAPAAIGELLDEAIATVRAHLPQATFAVEAPPDPSLHEAWFAAMPMDEIAFVQASGAVTVFARGADFGEGGRDGASWIRLRDDLATVARASGKPVVVDDGYGRVLFPTVFDNPWLDPSIIAEGLRAGVVGATLSDTRAGLSWALNAVDGKAVGCPDAPGPGVTENRGRRSPADPFAGLVGPKRPWASSWRPAPDPVGEAIPYIAIPQGGAGATLGGGSIEPFPAVEIVAGGTFEDAVGPWKVLDGSGRESSPRVVGGKVEIGAPGDGDRADRSGGGSLVQVGRQLLGGREYRLSFLARSDHPGTVEVRLESEGDSTDAVVLRFAVGPEERLHAARFRARDAGGTARLVIDGSAMPDVWSIDAVSIRLLAGDGSREGSGGGASAKSGD